MRWMSTVVAALLFFWTASAAQARPVEHGGPVFDAPTVSSVDLDAMRGTASPAARPAMGMVARILDDESRAVFRQTQAVAPTIFDWWFSTTGLEMITANVRAAA